MTGDPAQLETLLSAAPNDARIRYVSPVGPKRHLLHRRNDPYTYLIDPATNAPYEWQVAATHLDKAFNLSHGRPDILLCSVDSGVADIPDLKGKVVDRLYDPTLRARRLRRGRTRHRDASIMVSTRDDGFGIVGFGGDSRLISYRVDDLWDNAVAVGINRLTSLGCRIINLSFGGPHATSPVLLDSIRKALYAGVLIVAAAGNDGTDGLLYPAADVQPANGAGSLGLAVGASDFHGNVAEFSNTGDNLSLVAPGDYVYPACHGRACRRPGGVARLDRHMLAAVRRRGGRALRVRRRHLVCGARGRGSRGAHLGGAPGSPQLGGRRDHQAVRSPRHAGLEPDQRLRRARRGGRARAGDWTLQRRRAQADDRHGPFGEVGDGQRARDVERRRGRRRRERHLLGLEADGDGDGVAGRVQVQHPRPGGDEEQADPCAGRRRRPADRNQGLAADHARASSSALTRTGSTEPGSDRMERRREPAPLHISRASLPALADRLPRRLVATVVASATTSPYSLAGAAACCARAENGRGKRMHRRWMSLVVVAAGLVIGAGAATATPPGVGAFATDSAAANFRNIVGLGDVPLFVGRNSIGPANKAAPHQPRLTPQNSGTTQGLIAVSPVNKHVVWASGRGGTFAVTTDGGASWRAGVVPGAESLQFRDVEGVSDRVAYLLSIGASGPGDFRIYKTIDGGATLVAPVPEPGSERVLRLFRLLDAHAGLCPERLRERAVPGAFGRRTGRRGRASPATSRRRFPASRSLRRAAPVSPRRARRTRGRSPAAHPRPGSSSRGTAVTLGTPTTHRCAARRARACSAWPSGTRTTGWSAAEISIPAAPPFDQTATSGDGGKTWAVTPQQPNIGTVYGLSYTADGKAEPKGKTVVVTGPGGAAWTPDEGDSWFTLPGVTDYWGVAFGSPKTGWLVGTEAAS